MQELSVSDLRGGLQSTTCTAPLVSLSLTVKWAQSVGRPSGRRHEVPSGVVQAALI